MVVAIPDNVLTQVRLDLEEAEDRPLAMRPQDSSSTIPTEKITTTMNMINTMVDMRRTMARRSSNRE